LKSKTKEERYGQLVVDRKQCRRCGGLVNPGSRKLAKFDSSEIGPWSRMHGDLDADLMIVGQDWGTVDYFWDNQGLDNLRNPTMQTLELLLKSIGIKAKLSAYGANGTGVFLTNAILCLKEGGLQSPVESDWFKKCGMYFLKQQIEIVSPFVVVALGQRAYEAITSVHSLDAGKFRDAVEDPTGVVLPNGSRLIAVYHCGKRILNTHRPLSDQLIDWKRVKRAIACAKSVR
jgi:DNA polymerase